MAVMTQTGTADTAVPSPTLRRRSPYPGWFFLPAAIIYGVLFLLPDRRVALFQPDALDAVQLDLHRARQFRAVPARAVPDQGADQHR